MKKILSLILVLLMLAALCIGAAAAENLSYVHDNADLFSTVEVMWLDGTAQKLGGSYDLNIAIVTTDTLDGKSPQRYAEDYYDRQFGAGTDGILFLLSMEDRDWYISTSGKGMKLFTDGEVDDSFAEIREYMADDEFYDGFAAWLKGLSYYLDTAEPEPQPNLGIALVIGAIVALVTVLIMRAGMNTKRQQHSARHYLTPGSYHLRTQQDIFLYSRVTRTARPKNTGSGSSGSSGSRSHGGGGGKF